MSDVLNGKPTTTYYVLGAVFLVWNLIGLMFYYQQSTLTPEMMEELGLTMQQIGHISDTPVWAHSGYAIAVNAGVLGAIFLLLRKSWAIPFFVVSLVGALVQDLDAFILRDAIEAWGPTGVILPIVVILIGTFEIWYSRAAKEKGWLS